MTIINILELYNLNKLKERDLFISSNENYDNLIYLNNELHFYDHLTETERVLTFSDIAELLNENIIYRKCGI